MFLRVLVAFAPQLLRHRLVDGEGQDQFARFGRNLHMVFEEGHPFELSVLEHPRCDVTHGEIQFAVLLQRIVVVEFEVTAFLGGNDLAHKFHCGVVFARIFGAFRLHRGLTETEIGRFENNDEAVAAGRRSNGTRNVTHRRGEELPLSVGNVEASLDVALGGHLRTFVEEVDKRDGRARLGIDHPSHHALTEANATKANHPSKRVRSFFHCDESKKGCVTPRARLSVQTGGRAQRYENYFAPLRFLFGDNGEICFFCVGCNFSLSKHGLHKRDA